MSVQLEQAKQSLRKIGRRILWLLVIITLVVGAGYFAYSQMTYSEGRKSGQLVKISRRGVIFKTYEGTLNISPNGIMTPWDFSAENNDIAEKLQNYDGKQVILHYKQRYQVFFWQGDTDYIVDDVEPVNQ